MMQMRIDDPDDPEVTPSGGRSCTEEDHYTVSIMTDSTLVWKKTPRGTVKGKHRPREEAQYIIKTIVENNLTQVKIDLDGSIVLSGCAWTISKWCDALYALHGRSWHTHSVGTKKLLLLLDMVTHGPTRSMKGGHY